MASSAELSNVEEPIEHTTETETETKPEYKYSGAYPLYMVYSNWGLNDIQAKLNELNPGNEDNMRIGTMRIDRGRDGKETNRTFCLMDHSVFKQAQKEGLDNRVYNRDFTVKPYILKESNLPGPEEKLHLFLPLSQDISTFDVRQQLEERLSELELFDILPPNSYQIRIPLKSRATSEHKGLAFVYFNKNVSEEAAAISRLILHDVLWYHNDANDTTTRTKCYWAKGIKRDVKEEIEEEIKE